MANYFGSTNLSSFSSDLKKAYQGITTPTLKKKPVVQPAAPAPTTQDAFVTAGSIPQPVAYAPAKQPVVKTSTSAVKTAVTPAPAGPTGDIELSKSGRYGITASGDVYDMQTKTKIDQPTFQSLKLNAALLPKVQAPGTDLSGTDYKSYFEKINNPEAAISATNDYNTAKVNQEKTYQEGQTKKAELIKQSDEIFNTLYGDGSAVKSSQEQIKLAKTKLGEIDSREQDALGEIKNKPVPSWAAAGQMTIVSSAFAGERAKAATQMAIAQDDYTNAATFASQSYQHSLDQLNAKIGFINDALTHAKDLTEQERTDMTDTLNRATDYYNEKKAEAKDQNDLYIALAQKGVTGIAPDMTVEQMSKIAGPVLSKQALEDRALETSKSRATIAKTTADLANEKPLTVAEAKSLGVPYGTTKAQAMALGKVPGASSGQGNQEILGNISIVDDVLKNAGSLSGPIQTADIPFTGGAEAKNKYNQLVGLLKLENRQKLKGQGQISDFEGRILADASSALGRNLSEDAFKKELLKIKGAFSTAAGLKVPVMITNPKTGEFDVVQADQTGINNAIADGMAVEYK